MKVDDTIIDSDILESQLKELWAKCYFESWNLPRIRFLFKKPRNILIRRESTKEESTEKPTEEHPSIAPNIHTSNSSNIKDNST